MQKPNSKIERALKFLALIQLPIVIIQLLFYKQLMRLSAVAISFSDFRFGTFYVKGDPIMSTFLILLIIYLLFVKRKISLSDSAVVLTSIISTFIGSSRLSQMTLLLVVGYYFVLHSSAKQKAYSLIAAGAIFFAFYLGGYGGDFGESFTNAYKQATLQEGTDIGRFKNGQYSRGGAILYFLDQDLKVIGDGPGKHTNALEGELSLGLNGAYFKAYAELGIIGLLFLLIGIIIITREMIGKGPASNLIIITMLLFGVTQDLYNHADIMFVFYLFLFFIKSANEKSSRL